MVTLAEERLQREPQGRCSCAAQLPQHACAASARSRRSCAAPAACTDDEGEGAWRRLILDFRSERRDPQFRQRRGARALRPGRRGHARPHHPHQELAADRSPRPRPASSTTSEARRATAAQAYRRALPATISPATTRASAAARRCSIRCRAWCWCRASACSASAASKKDARIAADLAEAAVETITDAEAIGRFQSISEADMFDMRILVAGAGQARRAPRSRRSPARSRSSPAPAGAIGAATAQGLRGARAPKSRCSTSNEGAAAERAQGDRRRGARGRLRRHRCRLRARGLRPGRRARSAASTSWCRMPARPGRAASARSTRRCCARASS